MSQVTERLISPLPTVSSNVSSGATSFPIHPISVWPVGAIPSAYLFPGKLDETRLVRAVEKVSAVWPVISGRFEQHPKASGEGFDFSIKLTASPIPLSTQTLDASHSLPSRDVVQSTLAPFIPPLGAQFVRSNTDSHLFAIRLSIVGSKSVLGVNWSHVLGDAATASCFLRHLSHFYEDPDTPLEAAELPSFEPHISLARTPNAEEVRRWDHGWNSGVPLAEASVKYRDAGSAFERLNVRLSKREVRAMVHEVSVQGSGRTSEQDVISGWWLDLHERAGVPIQSVVYSINYRNFFPHHPSFPPNLPTLSANVAQMRSFPLPARHPDTSSIDRRKQVSATLRAGLEDTRRDPDRTLEWLSVCAQMVEETAIKGYGQVFVPSEGVAFINSNLRYDWIVPFGFHPEEISFHTTFSTFRFLRVFQANPSGEGERDIELIFSVPILGDAKAQMLKLVEDDRARWSSGVP